MNEILYQDLLGNPITAWFWCLIIIIGSFFVAKVLYLFVGRAKRRMEREHKENKNVLLLDLIEEPVVMGLALIGLKIGLTFLHLPPITNKWVTNIVSVLFILLITWLFSRVFSALLERFIIPFADKSDKFLSKQLLPVIKQVIVITTWAIGLILALNNVGFNVGALLAGLGIGGLAVAMAGKDTISNIFGGITIFIEKPFKIDDVVTISGYTGTIIDIGLRSSRLRTYEGKVVYIPNSKFIDSFVENISLRPSARILINLKLPIDTSPEKMEKAMEILKDIVLQNKSTQDNAVVGFNSYDDYSLGILFIYYIINGEPYTETQTAINLEVIRQFRDNRIKLALPINQVIDKRGE